jgi:hypothetical protein
MSRPINPYEASAATASPRRQWWHYVAACFVGLVGYSTLIMALGLITWLTYGWPVALENLERVARIHRELSLNTFAAFLPNVALAILVDTATIKWLDTDSAHQRCWLLGCMTIVGYVVVLFSTNRWGLIPWTWPAEISNLVRSALTLMFPVAAYLTLVWRKRRMNPTEG